MQDLVGLFCKVDDFCKEYLVKLKETQIEYLDKGDLNSRLSASEIMTLLIYFHQLRFRDFKTYYLQYVQKHLKSEFPDLVSYTRFVELMPSVLVALCAFVQKEPVDPSGLYFIDSSILEVCHIRRAASNKVFKGLARKGKSSVGWAYGFKLHLVINHKGQLMAAKLTHAARNDRVVVPELTTALQGKLIADKGYISQSLFQSLYKRGLQLITKLKKNMKNKFVSLLDAFLLRKRSLIETVFDQLKNISQIQHTRHRSPINFFVNTISALAAYSLKPSKPSLPFDSLLTLP